MHKPVTLCAMLALILGVFVAAPVHAAPSATVNRYDAWETSYAYSSAGLTNPEEQVTVAAVFHAPSGATLKWPGFFYGTNDYRVRFAPAEVGTYTYTVQITGGSGGTLNDSGSFTSLASSNKGFLRVTPSNPYRLMNEADGSIPYFVGMNQSWGIGADNGTPPGPAYSYNGGPDTFNGTSWVGGGNTQNLTNDQMFQLYGTAGFNMLRLFPGINGMSVIVSYGSPAQTGGPGNKYDDNQAAPVNPGTSAAAPLMDQIFANAHARGFHIQTGFFCGNQGCAGGPYAGPSPVVVPSSISNHINYMIARYGAWVDVWEINNEGNASATWAQAVTNYIRSVDPYKRMVTSSFGVANDWTYLQAASSHAHLGNGALFEMNQDSGNLTHGIPVVVGEIYNRTTSTQPQGTPCDPAYHRLYDWQSFIIGLVNIYWMENWQTCSMNAQTPFFGSTERAWTSVLAGVADSGFTNTAVSSRPATNWSPSNNNGQGADALSSSSKVLIYLASHAGDTTSYTGAVSFNFPFGGTGSWIDTKTGNVVGTVSVTAGNQVVTSPSFTEDIAFVVSNGASGPPPATPTPIPAPTSIPVNTPTAVPATPAPVQSCTETFDLDGTPTTYTRPQSDCTNQ